MTETDPDRRVLSGAIWDDLVTRIAGLRDLVWGNDVPDDPVVRAEGARYLLRFLAAGIRVCMELDDTEHPELGANIENRMSWGLDNPDCNYSYCRLRGDATRLGARGARDPAHRTGRRGTASPSAHDPRDRVALRAALDVARHGQPGAGTASPEP